MDHDVCPATVKVAVTAADIRAGLRGDRHLCPVARAVARAFPGRNVSVDRETWIDKWHASVTEPGCQHLVTYRYDRRVAAWIAAFDRNEDVQPFRFTLRGRVDWDQYRVPIAKENGMKESKNHAAVARLQTEIVVGLEAQRAGAAAAHGVGADFLGAYLPQLVKLGIDVAVKQLGGPVEAALAAHRDEIRRVVSDATLAFLRGIIDELGGAQ